MSNYTTTKLYGTLGVDASIMMSFRKSYFRVSFSQCMSAILARKRPGIGYASQCGKMVTLLNPLLFAFRISFLPNYRVKHYDYMGNVQIRRHIGDANLAGNN